MGLHHAFSTGLADGTYKVYAIDAAGNLYSASRSSVCKTSVGSAEGSIQPKYLPNAECPRAGGGAHWTLPRNLLFEFTDYGLQGTSLVAQCLHLRTQVGNF